VLVQVEEYGVGFGPDDSRVEIGVLDERQVVGVTGGLSAEADVAQVGGALPVDVGWHQMNARGVGGQLHVIPNGGA